MTIRPASGSGRNTAERVPTTTRASPRAARRPGARALAVAQPRVQRVHRHAEARAEARQRLRGQADLRHQHQRLLAARQAVGDRVQVDLGLAAAGDAVEQQRGEAVARGQDRVDRGLLLGVEGRPRLRGRREPRGRHRDAFGQLALGQRAGGAAPVVEGVVEAVFVARPGLQQLGQPPRRLPARRRSRAVWPASVSRHAQAWVSASGSPWRSGVGSAVASTSPSGAWV